MRKNIKKTITANPILIIILIGVIISLILLNKANFFSDYNFQNFNNITTPIATILAFVIYYATLIEIRNSNLKNINFQKINLFKERIENLRLRLENSEIKTPIRFQNKIEHHQNFNLISFYKVYTVIHEEMIKSIKNEEQNIEEYSMFFFGICFEFNLHTEYISKLIKEIQNSEFENLEKTILTEMLIKILNDYLYVNAIGKSLAISFKYVDEKNQTIKISGYDAPFYSIPKNELTTVFTYMEFDKVYNLMKENKMI